MITQQYDFSEAESLPVATRITRSLTAAHQLVNKNGYQTFSDFPCIPRMGASESELNKLEDDLGLRIPYEYRHFLSQCRYLKINDGYEIGGFDHDGIYIASAPWVFDNHNPSEKYLVFANYWRFADGDQLMINLSDSNHPVIACLHEHGPSFELYAPSFSLALWRLIHEADNELPNARSA